MYLHLDLYVSRCPYTCIRTCICNEAYFDFVVPFVWCCIIYIYIYINMYMDPHPLWCLAAWFFQKEWICAGVVREPRNKSSPKP